MLRCSRSENADLFEAARCGLGQSSAITKAHIRVRRSPRCVRTFHFVYDALDGLLLDQAHLLSEGRFQHMRAWYLPQGPDPASSWHYLFCVGAECADDPDDDALLGGMRRPVRTEDRTALEWDTHEWVDKTLGPGGVASSCPWTEAYLPWQTASECLPRLLDNLPRSLLAASHVIFQPMGVYGDSLPRSLAVPDYGPILAIGLFPSLPIAILPRALPVIEEFGRRLTALGGKRGLSGWVRFDHEDWKTHFGILWPQVVKWKEMFDPDGVLGSGFIRYRPSHPR